MSANRSWSTTMPRSAGRTSRTTPSPKRPKMAHTTLIDLHAKTASQGRLNWDDIHLTPAGAGLYAPLIASLVHRQLHWPLARAQRRRSGNTAASPHPDPHPDPPPREPAGFSPRCRAAGQDLRRCPVELRLASVVVVILLVAPGGAAARHFHLHIAKGPTS